MKNKIFKRIGLASLALLSTVSFASSIKAEETKSVCKTHNNYYFFLQKRVFSTLQGQVENAGDDGYITSSRTYFPLLEENAKVKSENRICLKKDTKVDGSCDIIWELKEFYEKQALISKGSTKSFNYDGENSTNYKVYSEEINGEENSYFNHGKWFNIVNNVVDKNGEESNDYASDDIDSLVGASILPTQTSINLDRTQNYSIYATIDRKIKSSDIADIEPVSFVWGSITTPTATSFEPAVYLITYETCEEKTVYNATINYINADTKKPVEFSDGSANPYKKSDLEAGYTGTVNSPKLEGCTVDKKEVTVTIDKDNPKDFEETVYYTCEVSNPKTGNALIIVAWIVGLGALGYSVYYFTKMRKTKSE